MSHERTMRGPVLATCAMLVATTLAGSSEASASDPGAIERIERYCSASWRNARISRQDWRDCSQAVVCELLERLSCDRMTRAIEESDSVERRELNRAIWRVTKRWQRSRHCSSLDDLPEASEPCATRQSVQKAIDELREFIELAECPLTHRQRDIVRLTLAGNSVAEIADRLQIPASRVSHDKYRAIGKLRSRFKTASFA